MIPASLRTDELGLLDVVRFGRGNRFSLTALRPEYATLELTRHREFATPIQPPAARDAPGPVREAERLTAR